MKRVVSAVVLMVVALVGALLTVYNAGEVRFNYLLGTVELPLFVLLLICVVVGSVLSLLAFLLQVGELKATCRQLRRQLRDAEIEIQSHGKRS